MTYQEGCHRVTRAAAKKRAAESAGITEENVTNKKRFVLGEISNFTEIVGSMNTIQGKKKTQKLHPKEKAKTKPSVVRPLLKEAKENTEDEKQLDVGVVSDDPQMCGYYASHIYEYLHQMEVQNDVSTNMRAILVDWQRLQLLDVSSMLIASKYEEINPPNVEDFCYITNTAYTKDQVIFPFFLLVHLYSFAFHSTLLHSITEYCWLNMKPSSLQLEFLGCYLAELSLLDYGYVKFLPSIVAASVIFLSRFIIRPKKHTWSSALQQHSGYKASDLKDCVLIIHDLYLSRRGGALHAARDKYKQHKFKCVAIMPASPEIHASHFEDFQVDISDVEVLNMFKG
ncbi:hypothetical protein F3Y22_tig00111201pilonHSYRG00075 [Hibiscus syriacus]|uniref:B-like cyclin n=1 Tax=Hibiscus syriacus TaxID=106335 RepID=A0A6A2YW45_HIBSY|nr:hypothetical protein F3Y22_tig00111201pilonHSYRG00075 [Hibiscus syriacus]